MPHQPYENQSSPSSPPVLSDRRCPPPRPYPCPCSHRHMDRYERHLGHLGHQLDRGLRHTVGFHQRPHKHRQLHRHFRLGHGERNCLCQSDHRHRRFGQLRDQRRHNQPRRNHADDFRGPLSYPDNKQLARRHRRIIQDQQWHADPDRQQQLFGWHDREQGCPGNLQRQRAWLGYSGGLGE